jgi:hypothetical protein
MTLVYDYAGAPGTVATISCRRRCRLAAMNDEARIIFANDSFYNAFACNDYKAMDALWASNGAVCCIHPGWLALTKREEIMKSWQSIFASGGPGNIRGQVTALQRHGSAAVLVCQETIGSTLLVATNIYRQQDQQWVICHHQATPSRMAPATAPETAQSSQPN